MAVVVGGPCSVVDCVPPFYFLSAPPAVLLLIVDKRWPSQHVNNILTTFHVVLQMIRGIALSAADVFDVLLGIITIIPILYAYRKKKKMK